jgi:predicted metal-dependent HD superfamily phosphohydrolase
MSGLRARWDALWAVAPAGVFEELVRRYSEPQRHYHTLQHLEECLGYFDSLRSAAHHPRAAELALWFHDAVYDVTRHDNEAQSAALARALLAGESCVGLVEDLIMATCHHAQPATPDQAAVVDADLAILAAPASRFAEYEVQIRAEYQHVPLAQYTVKRRAVLEGFLARPAIYSTPAFRALNEAAARANLAAAIYADLGKRQRIGLM